MLYFSALSADHTPATHTSSFRTAPTSGLRPLFRSRWSRKPGYKAGRGIEGGQSLKSRRPSQHGGDRALISGGIRHFQQSCMGQTLPCSCPVVVGALPWISRQRFFSGGEETPCVDAVGDECTGSCPLSVERALQGFPLVETPTVSSGEQTLRGERTGSTTIPVTARTNYLPRNNTETNTPSHEARLIIVHVVHIGCYPISWHGYSCG